MGITLQGHRNRILKHIPSVAQTSSAVGKETASLPMALNELDDILGNIEAMLGELDVDDADEQQTDRRMSVQQQQAEQLGIFKGMKRNTTVSFSSPDKHRGWVVWNFYFLYITQ